MFKTFKLQIFISFLFFVCYSSDDFYSSNFDLYKFSLIKVKSPCCSALRRIRRRLCCCCCSSSCDSEGQDPQENTTQEQTQSSPFSVVGTFGPLDIPPQPPYPAPAAPTGIPNEPFTFPSPPSQEDLESLDFNRIHLHYHHYHYHHHLFPQSRVNLNWRLFLSQQRTINPICSSVLNFFKSKFTLLMSCLSTLCFYQ